jgi:hypothetical protein
MMTPRTKVEDAFNTRIANICKSVYINELGDFENNSIFVLKLAGGVASGTIEAVSCKLREAGVTTIEDKIHALRLRRSAIFEFVDAKKKKKSAEWLATVKTRIGELQKSC